MADPEVVEPIAPTDNQLVTDAPAPVVEDAAPEAVEPVVEAPEPAPVEDHGNKGKQPWYMKRIHEETNAKQAERTAREAAEERARNLEEMLSRLQDPTKAAPAAARTEAPQVEFQTAVQREVARQRMHEDTTAVLNAGTSTFSDFRDTLNLLTTLGVVSNDDFVLDVLAVDKVNAHVLLDKLAKDPERATALAGMDSRRRIAELVRINDMAPAKPADPAPAKPAPAAPVSRAPVPKPALAPAAAAASQRDPFSDEVSDADFSAAWEKKFLKSA